MSQLSYDNHRIVITVTEEYVGKRIDFVLSSIVQGISRSKIQNLISSNNVYVDDELITSNSKKITKPCVVKIDNNDISDCYLEKTQHLPEDIPLDIIYEDEYIAIINKQAGLVCHPAPGHYTSTLVNAIIHYFGINFSDDSYRSGLVHRIDKDTSGLMLIAKTEEAHNTFSAMFQPFDKKAVTRKYICFCHNVPDPRDGVIDNYIKRHPKYRQQYTVYIDNCSDLDKNIMHEPTLSISNSHKDMIRNKRRATKLLHQDNCCGVSVGKRAITEYCTLAVHYYTPHKSISMVECQLQTGRTHQIRVHMKHIGCNIIGDQVYGAHVNNIMPAYIRKFCRQALHSYSIEFHHPFLDKHMYFTCGLPDDLLPIYQMFDSAIL